MTTAEWQASADAPAMIDWLEKQGYAAPLWEFATACCRRVWDELPGDAFRRRVWHSSPNRGPPLPVGDYSVAGGGRGIGGGASGEPHEPARRRGFHSPPRRADRPGHPRGRPPLAGAVGRLAGRGWPGPHFGVARWPMSLSH